MPVTMTVPLGLTIRTGTKRSGTLTLRARQTIGKALVTAYAHLAGAAAGEPDPPTRADLREAYSVPQDAIAEILHAFAHERPQAEAFCRMALGNYEAEKNGED